MSVPAALADEVLACSARHCCVCRRFRPLLLQVHHIVPRSEGGPDELDNLIPICVSCHADVHTETRLTRRFTAEELKRHRDNVYSMVADGRLPAGGHDSEKVGTVAEHILQEIQKAAKATRGSGIPPDSLEILLAAACEQAPIEIKRWPNDTGMTSLVIGQQMFHRPVGTPAEAELPNVLAPLLEAGLLDRHGDSLHLSPEGMSMVDDLISSQERFTEIKVKCMVCDLHFVLCTWYPEKHSAATLTCPECGNKGRSFAVWQQRRFGFIFEHVPGAAGFVELDLGPEARERYGG